MKKAKHYKALKDMLSYCKDTGVFTWIVKRKGTKGIYSEAGYVTPDGYRAIGITVEGKFALIKAHRLAWFFVHGEIPKYIDHINRNKLDNSISNLRECTPVENCRNRNISSNCKSGIRGVSWSKANKKWRADININKKHTFLGYFDTIDEATERYKEMAIKTHGEFYVDWKKENNNEQ